MSYFAIIQVISFFILVALFNTNIDIFNSSKSFLILTSNNIFFFIVLSITPIALNFFKFFYFLRHFRLHLPFKSCAFPICATVPLNIILPAKSGDFIKFFWIRNNSDFSKKKTTFICISERLLDLATITFIITASFLFTFIPSKIIYISIFFLLLLIFFILLKYRQNSFLFLKLAFLINTFRWTVNVSVFSFLISSIHSEKNINIIDTFIHASVSIIIGILPISFWGFGTRESYLITVFPDSLTLNTLFNVGIEYITLFYWIPALILTPFSVYFFTKKRG